MKNADAGKEPVFSDDVRRFISASGLAMDGIWASDGKPTFFSCSCVGPSKCDECGEVMEPESSSTWRCVAEGCPQKGIPVITGVFGVVPDGTGDSEES